MDTQGTKAAPFLKAVDLRPAQIEATQGKLDNLFEAMGIVGVLSNAIDTNAGWEVEANQLAPLLQTFADFGKRLMTDLKADTGMRDMPTA